MLQTMRQEKRDFEALGAVEAGIAEALVGAWEVGLSQSLWAARALRDILTCEFEMNATQS